MMNSFAEWDMNGNQFFYNPCRSFDAAFPDCTGDTAVSHCCHCC